MRAKQALKSTGANCEIIELDQRTVRRCVG